jgi:hypothetical protein
MNKEINEFLDILQAEFNKAPLMFLAKLTMEAAKPNELEPNHRYYSPNHKAETTGKVEVIGKVDHE